MEKCWIVNLVFLICKIRKVCNSWFLFILFIQLWNLQIMIKFLARSAKKYQLYQENLLLIKYKIDQVWFVKLACNLINGLISYF